MKKRMEHAGFSGDLDVDRLILLELTLPEILKVCETNQLYKHFCSDEVFWMFKLEKDYPGASLYKGTLSYRQAYEDFYKSSSEHNAFSNKHYHVMQWFSSKGKTSYLSTDLANTFAKERRFDLLKWLSTMPRPVYPDSRGADLAVANNDLEMLIWMNQFEIYPSIEGLKEAVKKDYYAIIEWANLARRQYLPMNKIVDYAAELGKLEMLQWMIRLTPPVRPDQNSAVSAAAAGRIDILEWMANLDPPVYPDNWAIPVASERGHLNVLKWLYPRKKNSGLWALGITIATMNGHIDIIKWYAQLSPPLYPSSEDITKAIRLGNLNVLEYLEEVDPQLRSMFTPEKIEEIRNRYY